MVGELGRSDGLDDEERFDALWLAHADAVLAYARRRTASEHDAVDLVADTFLVVWRRLDAVPDQPRPWIYAVARNVLANQRRSFRRRAALAERLAGLRPGGGDAEPDVESPAGDGSSAVEVWAALDRLTDADREVLMLVAWEGLDAAQAAMVVGCSPAAFRVRLHRARRRLGRALAAPAGWSGTRSESETGPVLEEETT